MADVFGLNDALNIIGWRHDPRQDGESERLPSVQRTSSLPAMINPSKQLTVYVLPDEIESESGFKFELSIVGLTQLAESLMHDGWSDRLPS
jgi:hypothetical protein